MRSISIIIRFEAEKKMMMVVKFFSRRNTFMHTAIGNVLLSWSIHKRIIGIFLFI